MPRLVPLLLLACRDEPASLCDGREGDPDAGAAKNVLVIVGDDVGIDKVAAYGEHPYPASTPNIDALAAEGVLFRNAYGNPTCSPSRASLLTGRHASRTRVGRWIYPETEEADLPLSELTIPEMLRESPHAFTSAAVGKWHLVSFTRESPGQHPLDQGFDCHAGSLGNPLDAVMSGETPRGFTRWEKSVDGELAWEHTYMSTDTTDEALARINGLRSPWFLWVAYNDAHTPLHVPPADLTTGDPDERSSKPELFDAAIEALDTEIGRLLRGIPDAVRDDTTVIYLSDNGTPDFALRAPWNTARGKGTPYESGVNVPFIVTGPFVAEPGSESDALVHFVDLFPTVAEIAGVDLGALTVPSGEREGEPLVLDGVSFLPYLQDPSLPSRREILYTETFYPNGDVARDYHHRMVRDADWKLIRWQDRDHLTEMVFRLDPEEYEEGYGEIVTDGMDAEEAAAAARLRVEMDALEVGWE